jgi:hypothetical protein
MVIIDIPVLMHTARAEVWVCLLLDTGRVCKRTRKHTSRKYDHVQRIPKGCAATVPINKARTTAKCEVSFMAVWAYWMKVEIFLV